MAIKPRTKGKAYSPKSTGSQWFNRIGFKQNKYGTCKFLSIITTFVCILYFFSSRFYPMSRSMSVSHPPSHGLYINEIPASSRLIFPHVEHLPVLKQITVKGLYNTRLEVDGTKRLVLKAEENALTDEEKKKTTDQVLLVKRSFLDHGKLVYRKTNDAPKVVVVTLIDFENYDMETVIRIVQNRVDYAQKHQYGVYVRWIQEFLPVLENQNLDQSYDFVKPLMIRAAMHAFPTAKYIHFVDQDALLMNLDLSLQKYLLDPKILDLALLRNVPVVANSNIKTYNHFDLNSAKIIIPHDTDGNIDTYSFVVANDFHGQALVDYLNDPLLRNFPWETKGDKFGYAIGHLLQWHPTLLGKTAIVIPKVLASQHDASLDSEGEAGNGASSGDAYHYNEGDLAASFKGCRSRGTCASEIRNMYEKIKKS
ncbi:alpha-1,6-mannosyltransferase [Saccharomyces eubayanus]|uniref:alpha-1,6-mannosyltransferase n=1 Tax=Saccharomyces eubayanus TaxID=1080349 RepID=UPI0006BEE083|nr:MNN11-like protein [Saccharomyces eubayanus]KOG98441.1 MNN11-like protein [Saccharomyces eubayanus]